MIVDCISDLHGEYPKLQGGDLLIVGGDLIAMDSEKCWLHFENWIYEQEYKEKIMIAGNHDNFLATMPEHNMWKYWEKVGVTYLCDSGTEFEYEEEIEEDHKFKGSIKYKVKRNLKIWGSPWSLTFPGINPHCTAFAVSEYELAQKYSLIPKDVDILVTHSPPRGILDKCRNGHVGSLSLRNLVLSSRRFPNLQLHVFGHIHECGGKTFETPLTTFVNASILNEDYDAVHEPVRYIVKPKREEIS